MQNLNLMNPAPIVLFIYNRPWHTEQTLLALEKNELANESILYIFCDGSKENSSTENLNNIKLARKIAEKNGIFKKKYIKTHEKNKGLANSVIDGVTEIINMHGKVIVLEDDIVTGKGFLKYMNDALHLYENVEEVCSIHGYIYPIKTDKLPETFFLRGADCWGWATWKRGWSLFNSDSKILLENIRSENLEFEFDIYRAIDYTKMLIDQINGRIDSWAIRWYASTFLKNKLTLYPKIPLIKNIGFDGSGTHCKTPILAYDNFQDYCEVKAMPLIENLLVKKRIKQHFKPSRFHKLINFVNSI